MGTAVGHGADETLVLHLPTDADRASGIERPQAIAISRVGANGRVSSRVKALVNATADRLAAGERAGEPEVALMVERLRCVSPHWFRHTGVTRALESGTDPRYAQAQAGHASLATTMICDHKDMRRQREQLERVR